MEKPILIIVTIVVLLLVGIIVLAFFTGGLQNFQRLFEGWSIDATSKARCQADCAQACLTDTTPDVPQSCTDINQGCPCQTGPGPTCDPFSAGAQFCNDRGYANCDPVTSRCV